MKVSVIVPVYNTLQYLTKAVESVLNQTWKNMEVFLIDDGSTDGSGACLDRFAEADRRVIVIHQPNGGQGKARNVALDRATGDCFLFLDSDDFLDPDCVERLCVLMNVYNADIAVCGFRYEDAGGRALGVSGRQKEGVRTFSGLDAARLVLYQNELDSMPWAKLYKACVWRNVRFPEDRMYEDLATAYLAFLNADWVAYDATPRMTNCLRPNSDLRMPFCERKMMMLTTAAEIAAYADKRFPALQKAARCRAVAAGFFLYLQMEKNRCPAEKERCIKIIRKYRRGVVADAAARRKTRIGALLSYFGMGVVRIVYDIAVLLFIDRRITSSE